MEGIGAYTANQLTSTEGIAPAATSAPAKRRRRMSGMSWIFIGLLVFFVCAAAFTALVSPIKHSMRSVTAPIVKSYIGIDEFKNTDRGVIIDSVTTPGGPADQAGLIGGDVILSFDGQPIQNEDQLNDLMVRTPVGKTVDVEYIRDGEKKTTKLTTISMQDNSRLTREFERRPEGRTQFGYDDDEVEEVVAPGTNVRGVKLGSILNSRPADLAGIKEGDIVIEFDGVPIRTSREFRMRVRRALPYSTVKLVVMRGGGDEGAQMQKLEIPVKLGRQ
ncbi:MAG TPA: PDZ domain-containing protein [Pyrinomonadaceae bacterium]|nr:PDZ domain-containing protein [Pyrinomonadaceae bacterium]